MIRSCACVCPAVCVCVCVCVPLCASEFYSSCLGIVPVTSALHECIHRDVNEPPLLLTQAAAPLFPTVAPSPQPALLTLRVPDVAGARAAVGKYYGDESATLDGTSPHSFMCWDPDRNFLEVTPTLE